MQRVSMRMCSFQGVGLWVPLLVQVLGCAHYYQPRCSEYRQLVETSHAELAAGDRVRVGGGHAELPALELSEEAALLSKRLKTLCDLLWDERISYQTYSVGVDRAFEDYQRARGSASPLP